MLSHALVRFYRQWHGRWHLPGSRALLVGASHVLPGLQRYPLRVPDVGTVTVDFRDYAGLLWLQHTLGEVVGEPETESTLIRAILAVLRDGETFWDLGANLGLVTTAILKARPHSRILAVEPSPAIADALATLVQAHPRVTVARVAMSDTVGTLTFGVNPEKSTMSAVLDPQASRTANDVAHTQLRAVAVPCVTGDALLQQTGLIPHVIKIDVEGHEHAVLRGLAQTLADVRPVIFFEHLHLSDAAVEALVPAGYRLRSIIAGSGRLTDGFQRESGHNSVLWPHITPP